ANGRDPSNPPVHARRPRAHGCGAGNLPGVRRRTRGRPVLPAVRPGTGAAPRRVRATPGCPAAGRGGRCGGGMLRAASARYQRLPQRGGDEAAVRAQGVPGLRAGPPARRSHARCGTRGRLRLRAAGHAGRHGSRAHPLRGAGLRTHRALLPQPHRRGALPQGRPL
ncbi:MAG: Histone acetyltransferase HPA2 and related acetyltransferases, partial [uncultured Ramlibacter sp.]